MTAKALPANASDEQDAEAPHLLRVVEAASALSPQNDPRPQESKKAKGSSLGSLKLNWLEQVTNDTGVTDAAFRCGHKIAQHINERELCAWPKLATVASMLGRSERSVRDGVHILVHRQHLVCSKRGSGNLNQYELLLNGLSVEERDRAEAAATAAANATKAASRMRKAEAYSPQVENDEVVRAFDRFIEVFPLGNRRDRDRALALYRDHLKDGITAETMLLGAEAYRRFCDEGGITGTTAVCGADYWLDIWGWRATDPDDIPLDDEAWA